MTFTLRSLLLAFMVIASALGAFGLWGLLLGPTIVGGVALFRNGRDSDATVAVTALLILALLVTLLLPVVQSCRESASRVQCMNNLKQIALALHQYHDQYGSFPPAYVAGPDGKPWHSWRVLILPFIEAEPLYAMYNFDEPWDGPNNRKLAAAAPHIPVY
ncbi:MAG: DUF1559 domain-containing protein, partial [Planctomycetota bacterium]|nr:DUF1559 domain-containing protein [Planctomycetota bacterium]